MGAHKSFSGGSPGRDSGTPGSCRCSVQPRCPGTGADPGRRVIPGSGEQDGAHDPGAAGEERGLPGPADTALDEGVMIRG